MITLPNLSNSELIPLNENTVQEISCWIYPAPYSAYSYAGHEDDYLTDRSTWGTEQFCLICEGNLIGQVACQFEDDILWVGWSMAPELCGHGLGVNFVKACIKHLRKITQHNGTMLLRVAAWNTRAIKAYQRAGFHHVKTIMDEIAYSGITEPFWVMEWKHNYI